MAKFGLDFRPKLHLRRLLETKYNIANLKHLLGVPSYGSSHIPSQISCSSVHSTLRIGTNLPSPLPPEKRDEKLHCIIINSATHCAIVLEFDRLVQYRSAERAGWLKSPSSEIQDGGQRPN